VHQLVPSNCKLIRKEESVQSHTTMSERNRPTMSPVEIKPATNGRSDRWQQRLPISYAKVMCRLYGSFP